MLVLCTTLLLSHRAAVPGRCRTAQLQLRAGTISRDSGPRGHETLRSTTAQLSGPLHQKLSRLCHLLAFGGTPALPPWLLLEADVPFDRLAVFAGV